MFKYQTRKGLDLFKNMKSPLINTFTPKFFFTSMFKNSMPNIFTSINLNKSGNNLRSISIQPKISLFYQIASKNFGVSIATKRKQKLPDTRYKMRTHRGLFKRIRIVGPRWDRQFKFYPTNNVHKMSNKSRANLRRKRQCRFIAKSDIRRVRRLLPYYKRNKYKH